MTFWVSRILFVNVIVFVLIPQGSLVYVLSTLFPPALVGLDAGYYPDLPFRPWTAGTYMFLHASVSHLFFNMLGLFFFGRRLEDRLGGKRFLRFYLLSGLGGAIFSFLFSPGAPVVGASAAVYGVLIGFAKYWPHEKIYIWGILPVEARWLVGALVVISLYSGFSPDAALGGGVAHFAHLGGLAMGYGLLYWQDWHKLKDKREFQRRMYSDSGMSSDDSLEKRWSSINSSLMHDLNREEIERLLTRVKNEGARSLSREEKAFLNRFSSD
ncbi:MAG: rhomboid family intramembrane serine protease [Longimicrobiales bacterium]|nr:rhomboid family intramembrane serine protease [Longimicrobiales bacterium]